MEQALEFRDPGNSIRGLIEKKMSFGINLTENAKIRNPMNKV